MLNVDVAVAAGTDLEQRGEVEPTLERRYCSGLLTTL